MQFWTWLMKYWSRADPTVLGSYHGRCTCQTANSRTNLLKMECLNCFGLFSDLFSLFRYKMISKSCSPTYNRLKFCLEWGLDIPSCCPAPYLVLEALALLLSVFIFDCLCDISRLFVKQKRSENSLWQLSLPWNFTWIEGFIFSHGIYHAFQCSKHHCLQFAHPTDKRLLNAILRGKIRSKSLLTTLFSLKLRLKRGITSSL